MSFVFAFASLLASCQAAPVTPDPGPGDPPANDAVAAAPAPRPSSPASRSASELLRIPEVAERAVLSVVNISTSRVVSRQPNPMMDDPFYREFRRRNGGEPEPQQRQNSLGSGVIVDAKGIVLTNHHVAGEADEIKVTLSDGRELEATRVGTDRQSDLAVLQLTDPPRDLVALPMGDSQALRLGELVLAIGNPFGIGQTVTMGIVSAKGRANLGILDYEDFIQTDASINPGNSGGALVNLSGELVGINTAIFSRTGGSQGIGFAIPSRLVTAIMEDLVEDGKIDRGFLGVSIQDLTDDLRAAMELGRNVKGVLLADVTADSPAEQAGFERGDIVVEFNGKPIRDAANFRLEVATAGSGKRFEAVVLRDGKRKKITGTLGAQGASSGNAGGTDPGDARGGGGGDGITGLTLGALDNATRSRFGIPPHVQSGAVVVEVEPDTPAAAIGLAPGDVIVEIGRDQVLKPADVKAKIAGSSGPVLFVVVRRGTLQYIPWRR